MDATSAELVDGVVGRKRKPHKEGKKKKRKEKENWVNTQWLMITRPVTSSALAEALMGSPGR